MRLRKTLSVTLVTMALLVTAAGAAIARDSKNIVLRYDATAAGSHLASGDYRVQWQTHSPEATVTFLQKGKVVAAVEGKVVDRGTKYQANQVVFGSGPDGARTIQEIRFQGSSEVIQFD